MVSGFNFLRDARCSLQTKKREFLLCYSYTGESLIGWVFNQLRSLTDRSTFSREIARLGGGRVRELGGPNLKKLISRGRVALANSVEGRGGARPKKNLQIWDLQRLAFAEGRQPAANLTIVKDEKVSERKLKGCLSPSTMLNNDSKHIAVVSLKPLSAGFS